jgi:uncharacterized protein (DUF58 family)
MRTADILLALAGILITGGIFLGSPALTGVGVVISAYYGSVRLSFGGNGRVSLSLPERVTELEWVEIPVKVEGNFGIPGRVTLSVENPEVESEGLLLTVLPGEEKASLLMIKPLKKGTLELKVKATFTDMAGLFMKELDVSGLMPVAVLPSPKKVAEARRIRKEPNAFAELLHALGIGSESLEFEELREFLPGDDIKRIDWKATSRVLKPIVRVFKRETLADIYVLVNVDESFRRELRNRKTDYLTLILAQLIAYFARHGHRVGIVAYNDHGIVKTLRRAYEPRSALSELGLNPKPGKPQLRPSKFRPGEAVRRILRLKSRNPLSGVEKAARSLPEGSYAVILDDVGLHPWAIVSAVETLEEKGSRAVVLYPNPVRFMSKEELNAENIETVYKAYRERKDMVRKMMGRIKIVELSPRDLLPSVVRRL